MPAPESRTTISMASPTDAVRISTVPFSGVNWLALLITLDSTGTGRVELRVELQRVDPEASLTLAADILGQRTEISLDAGTTTATLVIDVPDAPVWWPVGYGEQPLADLTLVQLRADVGEAAHA